MANPQPTDAHLRIAHQISEQLMVSDFTEQQRRILDLILRLSWGCGKKTALIPHQTTFEIVGVRKQHIKQHLDWLISAMVITRDNDTYSFNKDFDQWRVSRAFGYTHQKLTELIKLNLNTHKKVTKNVTNKGTKEVTKNVTDEVTKNVTLSGPPKKAAVTKNVTEESRKTLLGGNEKRYHPTSKLASPKEILKKDDINISKTLVNTTVKTDNKNRLAEDVVSATTSPISLDFFIKKFSYAFGREPDSRERAQLRDLGIEIERAGGATEQQIHDAFKEATIHNKCSVSYVRVILLSWLGVLR